MLRSAGYFSGVPCPAEVSGCQRPYCPFRHKSKPRDNASSAPCVSNIENTIEKIKNELRGLSSTADNDLNPIQNASYEPIPYESSSSDKGTSVLPYARGPSKPKQKNIYRSHSLKHPSTDMEYDPVVNYSTSGRSYNPMRNSKSYNIKDSSVGSNKPIPCTSYSHDQESDDEISCDQYSSISAQEDVDEEKFVIVEDEDDRITGSATTLSEIFGDESDKEKEANFESSAPVPSSATSQPEVIDLTKNENQTVKRKSKKSKEMGLETKNKSQLKHVSEKKLEHGIGKKRKHGSDEDKPSKSRKVDKATKVKPKILTTKSNKLKKIRPKDMDTANITKYVDSDEIKQLDDDLAKADPYQECLKIFQEASRQKPKTNYAVKAPTAMNPPSPEPVAQPTLGKRRIAHVNATSSAENLKRPTTSKIKQRRSTPAQMMMARLDIIEDEEAQRVLSGQSAKRVAHQISNKMAGVRERNSASRKHIRELEEKYCSNPWYPKLEDPATVCGTVAKGARRVAHESKDVLAIKSGSSMPPRPRIAIDRHSKVPTNTRQRYLTVFIDECLRICNQNHEKAYSMALAEEEQCKMRSSSKVIYNSLAANTLRKLREKPALDSTSQNKSCKPKPAKFKAMNGTKKTMSHDRLLITNTKTCKGGYTIQKKEERAKLSLPDLYEKMCTYIMTHGQLDENGYPRPSDVPGKAEFRRKEPMKSFNASEKKICVRCGKEFFLSKKGKFAKEEECTYHWGRAYRTRVGKGWEKRYSCCQERQGTEGCAICDTHVHADNKLDRTGYMRSLAKSPPPDGNCGIYTLDCEMSYTTIGLELTRVSVLDHECKLVYDTFVRPSGRVLDYNTRWSGITEQDMKGVKTTLRDVQATFLCKFSADTVLMGHSLESDLVALRLIHETVVDTSIVFPHKQGFPYKRALRNLTSENLGIVIQSGASEGHDSAEDASACMKLMLWKIEEDGKLSSRT